MAEFALGLTKTAVAGTLGRVKFAFEEEAELKERVQADMQFITSEFQIMQSFLNASNAAERAAKNQVVRTWVRQLRDLAFDVEDCVDFVLHLDSPPWTNGLWRLVPSCCMAAAPPLPLDEAVAEIKRLKARVLDVSERNTRYNLIVDSTATTGQQPLIMSPSTAATTTSTTTSLLSSSAAAFHILSEVWEAAGKLRSTGTHLKELITGDGDNDLQVVSLWGSPGAAHLEASHVIREAYNDPKICNEFRTRLWVKLTTSAFNPDEFLNSLLDQFYQLPAAGANICRAELLQRFNMKRYLLIIQGVSNVVEWDAIKMYLPNTNNGSRIVVSTEQLRIALLCTGNPYQVSELARFSDGQSLCAFSKGPARRRHEREEEAHDQATKFELIGRDDDIHSLSRVSEYPGVVSLWGVAGVGKSTLVRVMCHGKMDDHARERKSIKYSWVNVPHPFHLSEFSQRLLLDFHSNDLQAKETAAISIFEGQDTVHGCCKILRENKCLVVIDGLRSTSDWDLIKGAFLPDPIQRISIIVITNEASIATHCASGGSRVFNVKGLDASSARELFTKIAWAREKQLTTDKIQFSESIVAKCGGLPKVIAAIGKYAAEEITKIRNQPYLDLTLATISRDIHDGFMGKLEKGSRFHTLKGLFSWMQSYFDACSDVLKPCIFYLSVYPAGYNIRPRRLLRRWVAEGYSRVTSVDGTTDDNGEMLFSELVQSSIIQLQQTPSSSGTMVLCQVNGFFHGYIISRPMEDNLVFALEGHCSFNSQRVGQHLTIRSCWDRDEIVFKSMNLSRLRSLTVFGEWRSFFISKDINMGLLRVLDLEDAVGVRDEDLEVIGKIFPRLKFLSLRGCEEITRLPDSLGGLRQLQTLDVRHTKVAMLPRAIIKLVKLQYVRAGCSHEPSDEDDDVGLTVAPEENCRSMTMPGGMASESTKDSDDKVPGVAATTAGCDGMSTSTSQATTTQGDGSEPAAAAQVVGNITNQLVVATAERHDGLSTSLPATATGSDGTSTRSQLAEDKHQTSTALVPRSGRARRFVSCSWLSKKLCLRGSDDNQGGVEVPADGLGKLIALHTLGVVNVSDAAGKAIIKELNNLTQLRKLGVSGINKKNWHGLCSVISGHAHLESLSVRLDEHQDGAGVFAPSFGDISEPPETLKSLKLGGNIHVSPISIKKLRNLIKVHLELTISTQEDIDSLIELPNHGMFRHLHVKAIRDSELRYGWWEGYWRGEYFTKTSVLKIDCGCYKLAIVFGDWIPLHVEVLVVHCSSTEASLEVSGLQKLGNLKEVWLKGSYSNAVKQHLQEKLAGLRKIKRVVLKLEDQPHSS